MKSPKLILASASPRRQELLQRSGVEFISKNSSVDETWNGKESPDELACRLARAKAEDVLKDFPDSVVIGADTVVGLKVKDAWKILGKPESKEEAREMLSALSNREHVVITGVAFVSTKEKFVTSVSTSVTFRALDADEIHGYIESREPFDKAGGYGIQGLGAAFVAKVNGSYTNVVGLPLAEVLELLRERDLWQPSQLFKVARPIGF